jgi:hypothetical protein
LYHAKKHKERVARIRSLVEKEFMSKGINDTILLEKTILSRVDADEKEFFAKIQEIKIRSKVIPIPEDYKGSIPDEYKFK